MRQANLGLFDHNSLVRHLEIAEEYSGDTSRKSLSQKNTGKFYTPPEIALPLIEQVLKILNLNTKNGMVSIIDPFCGDGRLLRWLIAKIDNHNLALDIHLWDYDQESVSRAHSEVLKAAQGCNAKIKVFSKQTDSFSEFFKGYQEKFDLVITNPPWEVVKPDSKELSDLNEKSKKEYIASLKDFSDRLIADFPLAKPAKSYGGWGVNLARVGTELSLKLLKAGGIAALVTPSTIFADQTSSTIRRWIFDENDIKYLNIFPAELKLFIGVDQPSVSFILERSATQKKLEIINYSNSSPQKIVLDDVHALLKKTDYVLPVSMATNKDQLEVLTSLSHLPQLSDFEHDKKMWLGRELDETNHKTWLSLTGRYKFIKGRNIDRFSLEKKSDIFINESLVKALPTSINYHRIVWRDVSRPTQKRRVIATMLPPGYATGNSLGVLHIHNSTDQFQLEFLLGLLSSFVFEFQLRAHLATAHISAGVMKKMRVPKWSADMEQNISKLVKNRLAGDIQAEEKLEVLIAKSYGLNRGQFGNVLSAFPKVTLAEKNALLSNRIWQ